jgi:hypothetical protein
MTKDQGRMTKDQLPQSQQPRGELNPLLHLERVASWPVDDGAMVDALLRRILDWHEWDSNPQFSEVWARSLCRFAYRADSIDRSTRKRPRWDSNPRSPP